MTIPALLESIILLLRKTMPVSFSLILDLYRGKIFFDDIIFKTAAIYSETLLANGTPSTPQVSTQYNT